MPLPSHINALIDEYLAYRDDSVMDEIEHALMKLTGLTMDHIQVDFIRRVYATF